MLHNIQFVIPTLNMIVTAGGFVGEIEGNMGTWPADMRYGKY